MRKIIYLLTVITLFFISELDAKPIQTVSFDYFYSSLSPYGEWIELQDGVKAWRPNNISPEWKPYSIGRWSWTNNGWYWDSEEPFGWATYHYGRWYNDENYGWIWLPDYTWGPSWVEWRYDNDYIGWAPLPPSASFSLNLGIRFSLGWHSHYRYWSFVNYGHFCDLHINNFFIDERRVSRFFEHTIYRTNYFSQRDRIINGGIDRSFVERRGGYRIPEREIRTIDNYRDFDKNRNNRNGGIVAFRPSQREIHSVRTKEIFENKRIENRSYVQRSNNSSIPMYNRNDSHIQRNNNSLQLNNRNQVNIQRNMNQERHQINQNTNNQQRSFAPEKRNERSVNRGVEKYASNNGRNTRAQRSTSRQESKSGNERISKREDSGRK
jgi:hypothetical protein